MSYILDALKKSERERTLGNIPTLDSVHNYPRAVAKHRWLSLLLLLILLLVVAGIVYGIWFWESGPQITSRPGSPSAEPAQATVTQSRSAAREPAVTTNPVPVQRPVPQGAERAPRAPSSAAPASAPAESAVTTESTDGQRATAYPSIDELESEMRNQVPDLTINVVSYSDQPRRRFVMVNQRIYREGQEIEGALRVIEIRREGAVLDFRGRRFIVSP